HARLRARLSSCAHCRHKNLWRSSTAIRPSTRCRAGPRRSHYPSWQRPPAPPRHSFRTRSYPPRRIAMTAPLTNRSMFGRLTRRLLFANRGRLFVILLALSARAAVSSALLHLQTDAKRRLSNEFRSFGANVAIVPHASNVAASVPATVDASLFELIPKRNDTGHVAKAAFLPTIIRIFPWDE